MLRVAVVFLCLLLPLAAWAEDELEVPAVLATYGAGSGPREAGSVFHLLDEAGSKGQMNTIGFGREVTGARASFTFECRLRVLEGGDGGSFLFLDTAHHGTRGPAPFLASAVEPNLPGTFAVGIDVHNPPSEEMFTPWGNYQDLPQREVSLHFDGREIVKRVAPEEFRGDFADVRIRVEHVPGGAEVSVAIAGAAVYEKEFIANLLPYEMRLGLAAGTRADATTQFDVQYTAWECGPKAKAPRPPLHVEVFHHVMTDNTTTSYEATVDLPPATWAFGRVLLTLDIHDAGNAWDEWDRNGHLYVLDDEGQKRDIVPFITSYRTPCHWVVDVTHFRPWLAGKRTFVIAAGTTFYKNRGYLMSVSLDFHHGTPDLEPYRITTLWHGTARYASAENHFRDFFTSREVTFGKDTKAARIATTTTGHSQVGEFTPSKRAIVLAPPEGETVGFENSLWKTDVHLNPNRPQFGTWQFARAGWAPGDWVRPWWIDLTPHVEPGQAFALRYEPSPYDFEGAQRKPAQAEINKASHVVRSFLIEYRDPASLVPAPVLRVTNVAADSNAAKGGIKQGDYLAEYNGARLDSVDGLRAAIQGAAAAGMAKIPIVVYRGAERLELELDPGRMGVNLANR